MVKLDTSEDEDQWETPTEGSSEQEEWGAGVGTAAGVFVCQCDCEGHSAFPIEIGEPWFCLGEGACCLVDIVVHDTP